MALTPDDVVLAALPLSHSFGLCGALLAPLLAGARVALIERFTPEEALRAIARHRVTVLPGVATMFRRMLDAPAFASADLSSLRLAVSGAAPCPWDLAEEWRARTGVRILRGYGMTELFRPISYLAEDPTDRPEAIGRPVPGWRSEPWTAARRTAPRASRASSGSEARPPWTAISGRPGRPARCWPMAGSAPATSPLSRRTAMSPSSGARAS